MDHFTRDLNELNRQYSFLEEPAAGRLAADFPSLEYLYSTADTSGLASLLSETTGKSRIILLLPFNDHPGVRETLEETFQALAAGAGSGMAVDLDIAGPHHSLLAVPPGEGVSDHFLYGVSPNKLIQPAARNPKWKILGPGTFTPRAGEIYADSRWNRLLNWMAGQSEGPLVILAPPLERFPELSALELAEQVLIITDPLDAEQQLKLAGLLKAVFSRAPERSAVRLVFLGGQPPAEQPAPRPEAAAKAPAPPETAETSGAAGEAEPTQPAAAEVETVESGVDTGPAGFSDAELPEIEPLAEEESPPAVESPPLVVLPEPGSEEEEEIFLPEELLFLDEDDEAQATKAGRKLSSTKERGGLNFEGLPGLKDVAGMETEAIESPAASAQAPLQPEPMEASPAAADASPESGPAEAEAQAESESAAIPQIGPETVEAGAADMEEIPAGEILEAEEAGPEAAEAEEEEALYLNAEPEDELEMVRETSPEEPAAGEGAVDEAALAGIEEFQETLEAPAESEMALELDPNPLGEPETVPEEPETAAAEPAGEELETLDLEDLEPISEDELEEIPAETTEVEPEAVAAAEETPGPTPAEAVEETLEAGPVAMEEPAAVAEERAAEPEAVAEESAPEMEEIPDAASAESAEAERPAAAAAAEKVPGEPSADEIDSLLSGAAGLDEIVDDLSLEALEAGPAKAAPPFRKKKKKKGSSARSLVTLMVLLTLAGGMFFVWKQGTVMSLVRGLPVFNTLQQLFPALGPPQKTAEQIAAEQALADSIMSTEIAEPPPPPKPQYTKLGYSIQLGSFRFLPRAVAACDLLKERGLAEVYVVPLNLDSLGSWNRLYLGYFDTAEQADTILTRLGGVLQKSTANIKLGSAAVRRFTPLALKIEDAFSADSLEVMRKRLERNDIPTYTVKLISDTTQTAVYRLYVGAFESREQAIFLRNKLFNIGIRAEIIDREG